MAQLPLHLRQRAERAARGDASENPTLDDGREQSFVYSVSGIQRHLRDQIESTFPRIYVGGEVSNLTIHGVSGHAYFTLKDTSAQLRCVMWRDQLAATRTRLQDGLEVIARGRVTIYERSGQLQMSVQAIQAQGAGAALERYRLLAEKLRREGLTDPSRRRSIPPVPVHVAVVTSGDGAAWRDILRTTLRRNPHQHVTLIRTPVQGVSAGPEIAAALRRADRLGSDLVILARGGGSAEDLAAFNEEVVARAIVAIDAPVITGIGHETDTTIADLVADLSASTPTAAAEHAIPVQSALRSEVVRLKARLDRALRAAVSRQRHVLFELRARLRDPRAQLRQRAQRIDELTLRLDRSFRARMKRDQQRLDRASARLARGAPASRIVEERARLSSLSARATNAARRSLDGAGHRQALALSRLEAVSPVGVLARGYALVRDDSGRLIRDALELSRGAHVFVQLSSGRFEAKVESVEPEPDRSALDPVSS